MRHNLLLVAGSLLVTLLCLEAGLRLAGWSAIEPHHLAADVGWEPIPGVSGTYRRESIADISFNALGLRGPAPDQRRPRIVLTGDSFVEAREVAWDETMAAQLEALHPGQVLNAGVSGWGTAQSWIDWDRRIAPLQPDQVVHFLYLGNDISNNSRSIDGHGDRPFFTVKGAMNDSGELVRDGEWPVETGATIWKNLTVGLRNSLHVVQFFRVHWKLLRDGSRPESWQLAVGGAAQEDALFRPPVSGSGSDWAQAWDVTERLLMAYRDAVEASGATFTLAVIGMPIQVHPDPAVRQGAAARLGVADLSYPLSRLQRFAQTNGIAFVDLITPMREAAETKGIFFHGFARTAPGYGHWNAEGQHAAATIVGPLLSN